MSASPSSLYEFGDFRLDVEERVLWRRDGSAVPLTPRVFDTLRYLVEHSGKVLDKEVLMEAVWPDAIVEENNLAQNISTLRRAFGESPGSQRYIVTVPGRGYRFIAEVSPGKNGAAREEQAENDPAPAAVTAIAEPPREDDGETQASPKSHALRTLTLVALTLCALGAALYFGWGRWAQPPTAAAPASIAPPAATIPEKSIAVLPFENLSDDARNSYFAAAVQDEILSNLARLADLKVISRTSASLYKTGNPRNVREIGAQLGVAHVVEGSVQHFGNRVRIIAQLIDARTDVHLWAQTYDREVADVLDIQSEIARTIADQLHARISPGEQARLARKPTENADAYVLYLRGRELETRFRAGPEEFDAGIRFYEQARDLDPAFALARARLSILISHRYQSFDPARTAQARVEAEEALRLRPDLGEARLALAYTFFRGALDYDRALAELERAGEMLPNSAEVPLVAAYIYKPLNKFRERIAALHRAENLDPRDPQVLRLLAMTLRWVREWPEATRTYDRLRAIQPQDPSLLFDSWRAQDEFRKTGDIEVLKKANAVDIEAGAKLDQGKLNAWLHYTAILERDYAAAERFLAQVPPNLFETSAGAHPKIVQEAFLTVARGADLAAAEAKLEAARQGIESRLAPMVDRRGAEALDLGTSLALLHAFLGRKDEAIREARSHVDAHTSLVEENYAAATLALVYARTGEHEEAITMIEQLLTRPALLGRGAVQSMTLTDLKYLWVWDPLRGHPRFEKILASPEPKTIY